jgi:ABC-type uncharacterized transport system auxiliary subunit
VPAAPEHKYYRLLATPTAPIAHPLLSGDLLVKSLRADGLYAERAIVFGDASRRQLQQSHYHHWLYAPGQLVQEYLTQRLRQDAVAPAVRLQAAGIEPGYILSGRIVRFEKATGSGQSSAVVALELRLENKGRLLWERGYSATEAAQDATMNAFVLAMETALNRIYVEVLADLGRAGMEG